MGLNYLYHRRKLHDYKWMKKERRGCVTTVMRSGTQPMFANFPKFTCCKEKNCQRKSKKKYFMILLNLKKIMKALKFLSMQCQVLLNQIQCAYWDRLRYSVVILMDSCSMLNFLNPSIATKYQLPVDPSSKLDVKIANGQIIKSGGYCRQVPLHIQGNQFSTSVFILTLGSYDVVLGVQWPKTLGPIV